MGKIKVKSAAQRVRLGLIDLTESALFTAMEKLCR